jgi:hypothetical protein
MTKFIAGFTSILLCATLSCKKSADAPLDFTYSGTPHIGYLITFHSNAGGGNYLWSFGDGSKSTDHNPNHTYSYPSSYPVTLIINNDSAKKITKIITILPAFDFTYSGTPAAGYPVSFTSNVAAGASFLWNFGDGSTSGDAAPSHVFSANGVFDVSLTINNEPDHIIKKAVNIFADGVYLSSIAGTRLWHHIYTDAYPWPPYHTAHVLADVTMSVAIIDPATIVVGGDTLTYNSTMLSDSVMVFSYNNYYENENNILYFNHFTSGINYYKYVHVSAGAGDANDHFYTP